MKPTKFKLLPFVLALVVCSVFILYQSSSPSLSSSTFSALFSSSISSSSSDSTSISTTSLSRHDVWLKSIAKSSKIKEEKASRLAIRTRGGGDLLTPKTETETETATEVDYSSGTLAFTLAREGYGAITIDDDILYYEFLSGYDAIIEPYISNELVILSGSLQDDTTYLRYTVCTDEERPECTYGTLYFGNSTDKQSSNVYIECVPYSVFTINVMEYDISKGMLVNEATGYAMCMYVRREIRSLSADDLEATMDAMYALWEYDESAGQGLYGDDFHSSTFLLEFHHFNAAWQDADHIHEGNGFLLQHIKLSNIFELSMQAVDKSTCLPYWDFTIESSTSTPLWDSSVMTEDVFGSMPNCSDKSWGFTFYNDNAEDAAIPDGRWAFAEAQNNDKYPDLDFGFGFMRAPWSMNPSPYVSRFTSDWQIGTTLPTCTAHYGLLELTSLTDFVVAMGDEPHATAHSLIGGVYGCDLLTPMLDDMYITDSVGLLTICGKWSFLLKELYRNNLMIPSSGCSTSSSSTTSTSSSVYDNSTSSNNSTSIDDPTSIADADSTVTNSTCYFICDSDTAMFIYNLKELIFDVPPWMNDEGWSAWYDFICTGNGRHMYPGDHLESASPTDPSFWPIHPTLERLLHLKYMIGGFINSTWATDYVCQHSACYEAERNETGN